jgi:glycerate-2-kinase
MIIKNKDLLATTPTRERALAILEAGLEAINTRNVINSNVKIKSSFLFLKNSAYDLTSFRKIYLLAFGKDSFAASKTLEEILGERLTEGICLSLSDKKLEKVTNYKCSHPDPSDNNVEATKRAIELLRKTTEDDLLLVVISGGGSAMLTAPYKINIEEKAFIAKTLMNSGADINELNIVRKHLSKIKGGRLAELAFPATIVSLIFSDVVGNDLSTIASGPTVMDHSTNQDAQEILKKYDIYKKIVLPSLELNETPKKDKFFAKVENLLLLDSTTASSAMEEKARALGYSTRIYSDNLKGEAHKVGTDLLKNARKGEALIASGETTVKVSGNGVGGRNQELVLSNLLGVKEKQVLISCASDGHDNSDFAGALGDSYTLKRAKEENLNLEEFLRENDSYHFFEKTGQGIYTGLLESNVADLMLVLTDK